MKHAVNLVLWRILLQRKLNKQLDLEQRLARLRKESQTALAFPSPVKSVSSVMASQDRNFQVVLLRKPYGVVLSLDLISSNSFLHIQDGKAEVRVDGLSIQPFAEFSLN
jgi:hypothetical protein